MQHICSILGVLRTTGLQNCPARAGTWHRDTQQPHQSHPLFITIWMLVRPLYQRHSKSVNKAFNIPVDKALFSHHLYKRKPDVWIHYDDVIMTMLASQITSLTVVYSIVYSDVNQRKHQSSASLAFVREIHRGPVNFPHKWPVTRKMFPFDDVIMMFIVIYQCFQ